MVGSLRLSGSEFLCGLALLANVGETWTSSVVLDLCFFLLGGSYFRKEECGWNKRKVSPGNWDFTSLTRRIEVMFVIVNLLYIPLCFSWWWTFFLLPWTIIVSWIWNFFHLRIWFHDAVFLVPIVKTCYAMLFEQWLEMAVWGNQGPFCDLPRVSFT